MCDDFSRFHPGIKLDSFISWEYTKGSSAYLDVKTAMPAEQRGRSLDLSTARTKTPTSSKFDWNSRDYFKL